MVIGIAMKSTPHRIATDVTSCPHAVLGVTSPYPTVENVTSTNQLDLRILPKSSRASPSCSTYVRAREDDHAGEQEEERDEQRVEPALEGVDDHPRPLEVARELEEAEEARDAEPVERVRVHREAVVRHHLGLGLALKLGGGPKSPVATQTRSKTNGRIAMMSMYRQTSVISGQRPSTTARRKMTSMVKATEQMSPSSTRVWPGRRRA